MDEETARGYAKEIISDSSHWDVEEVFKQTTSGMWGILLRHRLDVTVELYVWEKSAEIDDAIREQGIAVKDAYDAWYGVGYE